MGLALGRAALAIGGIEIAAVAVVARVLLLGLLLDAHLRQPIGGAEAAVRSAGREQLRGVVLVDVRSLTLTVRRERTADVRALVPGQADPVERVVDHLLGIGARARLVGVLDAEDELSSAALREHVVEQRDVSGADMRITRRGGRDPHTHGPGGGRHGVGV